MKKLKDQRGWLCLKMINTRLVGGRYLKISILQVVLGDLFPGDEGDRS